jgi:hypothetical protein
VPPTTGNNTINAFDDSADSMMLVGRVHVYSPDDLMADNFNRTLSYGATNDVLDPLQAFAAGKYNNNAYITVLENNNDKDVRHMMHSK